MAGAADFPTSYRDPVYDSLDAGLEQRLGLPVGMLSAIRTDGEKTDAGRVSSAGAQTPYQIIPATRKAVLEKYGIDAYLSPENAAETAGLLLRDSLKRNDGDPEAAVREYHGGTNRDAWGKQNDAYWQRVSAGMRNTATKALSQNFGQWMADNPASAPLNTAPVASPAPGSAPIKDLSAAFGNYLANTDRPPGMADPSRAPVSTSIPAPAAPAAPGIIDKAIGAGEAGLSALTGATGGMAGMIGGGALGMAQDIGDLASGRTPTPGNVERLSTAGAQALTYAPRTPTGQEYASNVADAAQNLLPIAAVLPGIAGPLAVRPAGPAGVLAKAGVEGAARDAGGLVSPAVGDAAAGAAASAGDAVSTAASKVAALGKAATTLPRRALERLTGADGSPGAAGTAGTPGTMGSVGSAGVDMATQRQALANSFPTPFDLTKGQASRDAAQMKFEAETAKLPDVGAPLRERFIKQNEAILDNLDTWIDQTGAEAPTLRATGNAVDAALVAKAARAKSEVNARYSEANRSPEANAVVDPSKPVSIGEGEQALTASPIDYLNSRPTGLQTTGLTDYARQAAIKLGIATAGEDGQLVGVPTTIRRMETWRKEISQATGYEPVDIRNSTILKSLIDQQTEPVAGPLYRQARAARARYAQEFEDRAVISKLLNNKRGTSDRQVALEDVFKHSVLDGSLDDVRTVRKVLQTGGADGVQAWKELQGATARHIRDEATKSVALDSSGNRVISPSALDKVIRSLDVDGKLDFVFGKKGAQQLRDIRDLAQVVRTVPPEAAVNMSNTASALLAAFGDAGVMGMTGAPVPIVTMTRVLTRYVKDRALRQRIEDALHAPNRSSPDIPQQLPSGTLH